MTKAKQTNKSLSIRLPRCCQCKEPIKTPESGNVLINMRKVDAYLKTMEEWEREFQPQNSDGGFSFTTVRMSDLDKMPRRVAWEPWCDDCYLPVEGSFAEYCIFLDRMATVAEALVWTIHLQEKAWFGNTRWDDVIRGLFPALPWDC